MKDKGRLVVLWIDMLFWTFLYLLCEGSLRLTWRVGHYAYQRQLKRHYDFDIEKTVQRYGVEQTLYHEYWKKQPQPEPVLDTEFWTWGYKGDLVEMPTTAEFLN